MILEVAQYLSGALVLLGALFCLTAAIGLLRLPDVFTRMHAASKAGVLGVGLILLSLAVASLDASVAIRSLIGIVFLALTTPVAAHLLARAALQAGEGAERKETTEDLLRSTNDPQ